MDGPKLPAGTSDAKHLTAQVNSDISHEQKSQVSRSDECFLDPIISKSCLTSEITLKPRFRAHA